jgi:hypothetical protein
VNLDHKSYGFVLRQARSTLLRQDEVTRMLEWSMIGPGHFGIPYISPKTRIVSHLKFLPSFPIPFNLLRAGRFTHFTLSSKNLDGLHPFLRSGSSSISFPFLPHSRKAMYNPHNRLIAPLALKLLHFSARRQISEALPIVWHFPLETDVFGAGDAILANWAAERAAVSPSFQLCISTEAVEDSVSADVTCGTTVWPVVTSSAEGLYSTFLSVFLSLKD